MFRPKTQQLDGAAQRILLVLVSLSSVVIAPVESFFPTVFPKLAGLSLAAALSLLWMGGMLSLDATAMRSAGHGRRRPLFWILAACFLGLICTVVVSGSPQLALWGQSGRNNGVLLYASLAIVSIALCVGRDRITATSLHTAHLCCAMVIVVYGWLQQAGIDFTKWNASGPFSILGNLDQAGSWYAITVISATGAALQAWRSRWQRVAAALLAVLASGLVIVVYRAPWRIEQSGLVLVLGVLLCAAALGRRTSTVRVPKWLLAAGVLTAITLCFVLVRAVLPSNGAAHRLLIWPSIIKLWSQHPVGGVGIGRVEWLYWTVRSDREAYLFGSESVIDDAHSVPLQLLVSGGLVLAMPLFVLAASVLRRTLGEIWTPSEGPWSSLRVLAVLSVLYMCQAAFSPEHPTLAIWGWVASAAVIARGKRERSLEAFSPGPEAGPRWSHIFRRVSAALLLCLGFGQLAITVKQSRVEFQLTRLSQWLGSGSRDGHSTVSLTASARERRSEVADIFRARPADVHAAILLSKVLTVGRDYTGQITIDSVVLTGEPYAFSIRRDLADTFRRIGRTDLALLQLERLVIDAPRNPRYWLFAAHAAAEVQDSSKAYRYFERADALVLEMGLLEESVTDMRLKVTAQFPYLEHRARGNEKKGPSGSVRSRVPS